MAFSVIVKPIAYFDLDEAINWYEKIYPGLGKRFLLKWDQAVAKISENPDAFSLVNASVRRIKY